ncbi:MAG: hypothetical protein AAF388_11860, partial [Bacteroidota bacterium]
PPSFAITRMKLLDKIGWRGKDLMLGLMVSPELGLYRGLLVRNQDGELSFDHLQEFSEVEKMHAFLQEYPAVPITLFIDLPEVVLRKIPRNSTDLLSAALKVKVDDKKDFCSQLLPVEEDMWYSAVIRREKVQLYLEKFGRFRNRIVGISFHPGILTHLIRGIDDFKPDFRYTLELAGHSFYWQGGLLNELEGDAVVLRPGSLGKELGLAPTFLPAYAGVLHYLLAEGQDLQGVSELAKHQKSFSQFTLGLTVGAYSLLLSLVLFVVGALAFTWINVKNNESAFFIQENQAVLAMLTKQETDIAQQQKFLTSTQSNQSLSDSKFSYFLDQMMMQLPKGVALNSCLFYPSKKEIQRLLLDLDEGLEDPIWMTGWAKESEKIAAFSLALESLDFVPTVTIHQSVYEFQEKKFVFILSLELDEN